MHDRRPVRKGLVRGAPLAASSGDEGRVEALARGRMKDRRPKRGERRPNKGPGNTRRAWTTSRSEVVEQLERAGLLPAIVFIFSRVGCDAAVQQCLNANLRLTTPEERDTIRAFVEERCADLPDEDLHVLGYH